MCYNMPNAFERQWVINSGGGIYLLGNGNRSGRFKFGSNKKEKQVKGKTLKAQIVAVFVLIMIVQSAVVGVVAMMQFDSIIQKVSGMEARATVNAMAEMIDSISFQRIVRTMDEEDQYYQTMVRKMDKIRIANNAEYLYTMAPGEGTEFAYIIDGNDPESEGFSALGDTDDLAEWEEAALECFVSNQPTYSKISFQEGWGHVLSAYAPIRDAAGEPIGIVGIDIPADLIIARINLVRNTFLIINAAFILGFIVFGALWIGRLLRPTRTIKSFADQLAAGDVSGNVAIKRRDELGEIGTALNATAGNIRTLIGDIAQRSHKVLDAAEHITANTSEMMGATEVITSTIEGVASDSGEQAALVAQAEAEVTSLKENVSTIVEKFRGIDSEAKQVTKGAEAGLASVSTTRDRLGQMEQGMRRSAASMQELTAAVTEVNGFLQRINDIAENTNLLSLNAAIEAARAGDMGRGFAVVAKEVMHLSEESRNAVVEITSMVAKMNDSSRQISQEMEASMTVTQDAVTAARQMAEAFESIGTAITSMAVNIGEVADRAGEFGGLTDSIHARMRKVSGISGEFSAASQHCAAQTQEQTAAMQEMKALSEVLLQVAKDVEQAVGAFKYR